MNSIKRMRRIAGFTQTELANLMSIPLRTLQDWENDRRKPPVYVKRWLFNELDRIIQECGRINELNTQDYKSLNPGVYVGDNEHGEEIVVYRFDVGWTIQTQNHGKSIYREFEENGKLKEGEMEEINGSRKSFAIRICDRQGEWKIIKDFDDRKEAEKEFYNQLAEQNENQNRRTQLINRMGNVVKEFLGKNWRES